MSFLSKAGGALRAEWDVYARIARSGAFRELVRWCLPALALGALARAALTIHFPYGYFQADTPDFLVTAERLLRHHALVIHGKKAFLAPILFTIPFVLHVPALIVIPVAQHLAGLAATVMAGALVRCWFRLWRIFIVPVTVVYTLNPALLWYEHALLAECHYLFCTTGLALAGTLLVRRATMRRFVWLIVALFFTAGSRPEGKLFVLFGLGVTALVYWGNWRLWAWRMGVMLACCAGIWMCSRSTQAGVLLYSTVAPLAPETSRVAPGFRPVQPANAAVQRTKYNAVERHTYNVIRDYLKSTGKKGDEAHVGALAQKLAVEALCHRPLMAPVIAADKFLTACRESTVVSHETSGGFTPSWLYDKQSMALLRRKYMKTLMKGLAGRELNGKAAVDAFLHAKYSPLAPDWFSPMQEAWSRVTLGAQVDSRGTDKRFVPGWPLFCLLAGAGMLVALIPRDRMWRLHLPWVATLMGVWFIVMLTGVIQPRYRFVFEPFWMLYIFLMLDFACAALKRRREPRATERQWRNCNPAGGSA